MVNPLRELRECLIATRFPRDEIMTTHRTWRAQWQGSHSGKCWRLVQLSVNGIELPTDQVFVEIVEASNGLIGLLIDQYGGRPEDGRLPIFIPRKMNHRFYFTAITVPSCVRVKHSTGHDHRDRPYSIRTLSGDFIGLLENFDSGSLRRLMEACGDTCLDRRNLSDEELSFTIVNNVVTEFRHNGTLVPLRIDSLEIGRASANQVFIHLSVRSADWAISQQISPDSAGLRAVSQLLEPGPRGLHYVGVSSPEHYAVYLISGTRFLICRRSRPSSLDAIEALEALERLSGPSLRNTALEEIRLLFSSGLVSFAEKSQNESLQPYSSSEGEAAMQKLNAMLSCRNISAAQEDPEERAKAKSQLREVYEMACRLINGPDLRSHRIGAGIRRASGLNRINTVFPSAEYRAICQSAERLARVEGCKTLAEKIYFRQFAVGDLESSSNRMKLIGAVHQVVADLESRTCLLTHKLVLVGSPSLIKMLEDQLVAPGVTIAAFLQNNGLELLCCEEFTALESVEFETLLVCDRNLWCNMNQTPAFIRADLLFGCTPHPEELTVMEIWF